MPGRYDLRLLHVRDGARDPEHAVIPSSREPEALGRLHHEALHGRVGADEVPEAHDVELAVGESTAHPGEPRSLTRAGRQHPCTDVPAGRAQAAATESRRSD